MKSGVHRYPGTSRIAYGLAYQQAVADELRLAGARRVFVLASGTLERETDAVARLAGALGERYAGKCARIGAHTPRVDVVAAANAARAAGADLLVTLGGGSVTDAAKLVAICLANDVTAPDQLDALRIMTAPDGTMQRPTCNAPTVGIVCIPTTLSAGEFSSGAGCTDTARGRKEAFNHPAALPRTVILDPAATVHTPQWLWLSTGIRAVDHAVEDLCSINPTPFSDATSCHALRLLADGLRRARRDPADLEARLDCQLGSWLSIVGSSVGVNKGASHGIGHVLGGTAGVPHGYTSCVMLPHVLRFNAPVNAARQRLVSDAMGRPGQDAADVIAALVAELGLPATLREVGVARERLDLIAANSMHDRMVHTNPRRIDGAQTVRALLEAAW